MLTDNKSKSFKLVIRPGDQKLRNSDYWAILSLCALSAFALLMVVSASI